MNRKALPTAASALGAAAATAAVAQHQHQERKKDTCCYSVRFSSGGSGLIIGINQGEGNKQSRRDTGGIAVDDRTGRDCCCCCYIGSAGGNGVQLATGGTQPNHPSPLPPMRGLGT